jgi:hypothetical protein
MEREAAMNPHLRYRVAKRLHRTARASMLASDYRTLAMNLLHFDELPRALQDGWLALAQDAIDRDSRNLNPLSKLRTRKNGAL